MNHKKIELTIRNLLIQFEDPQIWSRELVKFIKRESCDKIGITTITSFLYHAHLYDAVLEITYHQIKLKEFTPWDFFLESIQKILPLDKQLLIYKFTMDFFNSPNNEIPELNCNVLDTHYSEIKTWKKYSHRKRQTLLDQEKEAWYNQLKLFEHSQNPTATERKIIEKIEKLYPHDPVVEKFKQKLNFKEYKKVLNKYTGSNSNYYQTEELKIEKNYNKELLDFILKDLNSKALTDEQKKDFVIFFIFVEAYPQAIQWGLSLDTTWGQKALLLECYMLAQLHSQALEIIEDFDNHPNLLDNSNWVWTLHYYRAQCLWGLNLKKRAIEALDRIVNYNPDFRLSSQLLHEWKKSS